MPIRRLICLLILCLAGAECQLAALAGARSDEAEAWFRENHGKNHCPEAFIDICWEFDPAEAHSALSAPPPWDTYQRIVAHLRAQPLALDDQRSPEVYKGMRRGLLSEPLTRRQYAAVLADAAYFLQSPRTGDGVSAAMLLSALTQSLLPARLHLSSPEEWRLAGEVAALLVPACERALAELAGAAQAARLAIDGRDTAYTLARAEFCLASAYEFAAFVEQDPAEKERLLAQAFIVYSQVAENYIPAPEAENVSYYYWYGSLQIEAGMAGSRVAATDEDRLALARRLSAALTAALQAVPLAQYSVPERLRRSQRGYGALSLYVPFHLHFGRGVDFFLYTDVRPSSSLAPFFWIDPNDKMVSRQTHLNLAILEIWENCENADAGRAVVDALIGLYRARGQARDTYEGTVAALLLELYLRSGDEYWLSAAPGYLRAGGDPLSAGQWKEMEEQTRQLRAQLLAQVNASQADSSKADFSNLCRDPDGLVIRRQGDPDLITDQQWCAIAREFIARYPMVSEARPSHLGAEGGSERYIWESSERVKRR